MGKDDPGGLQVARKPQFARSLLSSLLVSTLCGGVIGVFVGGEFEYRLISSFGAGAAYGFIMFLAYHLLGPFSRVHFMLVGACSGALAGAVYDLIRKGAVPEYPPLIIGATVGWFLVAAGEKRVQRILEGDVRAILRDKEEPAGVPATSRRQVALGIVLGLAIGLLVDSVLVLWLRAPILYFVVFSLGVVLLGPIWLGIRGGIAIVKARKPRELSWKTLIVLALLLWSTAIALPWGVMFLWLRFAAHSAIPVYPAAHLDETKVKLGDGENTGDRVYLSFSAAADPSDIMAYYRNELGRRGWEEGQAYGPETRQDNTTYRFRQKNTVHTILLRLEDPRTGARNTGYRVIYEP